VAEAWQHLFALVCGQNPAHTWSPGGALLPCCQRCTGFYAGAVMALVLHLALRIRPSARFLQVHGLFLLQMVPLGFHWVAQGALVRTWSGLLYGFGVVSFLWLLPGARLVRVGEPGGHTLYRNSFESLILARILDHGFHRLHGLKRNPCWLVFIRVIREIRGSSRFGCGSAALWTYGTAVCLTLGAVPAMAAGGGVFAGRVLAATALAGLVVLGVLVASNLALGLVWLVSWRNRARQGLAR
jgi:uncharacterized membrane protein